MVDAEYGAVKAPNQSRPGDGRAHSYLPLSGGAPAARPPNRGPGGDGRAGSYPTSGSMAAVHAPDDAFSVGSAKMPQPPCAVTPGPGAIPVRPGGAATPAAWMRGR